MECEEVMNTNKRAREGSHGDSPTDSLKKHNKSTISQMLGSNISNKTIEGGRELESGKHLIYCRVILKKR